MVNSRKRITKSQSQVSSIPDWYSDLEDRYVELVAKKKEVEDDILDLRETLMAEMKANKITIIETDISVVRFIKKFKGRKVDSAKLKLMMPDVFKKYSTPYIVDEHIAVTIKKQ